MSDVTAVVLDLDGGAMLADCVASLLRQTTAFAKVLVFDNGSRTPVQARLDAPVDGAIDIIRVEENLGFAGGANAALPHVTTDFVALINNDVVLDDDWLAVVRAAFDDDAKLAAAQTILRRDAATLDGAGIDIRDGTLRQVAHGAPVSARVADAWGVSATATVYRVAALGGTFFDERFFAYYEDVDLCARLVEAGWRLRVIPQVKATHRGSQSASRLGVRARYLRTRNRYLVARRHRGVGRIGALLVEDVKMLVRGRGSLRGIVEGLLGRW